MQGKKPLTNKTKRKLMRDIYISLIRLNNNCCVHTCANIKCFSLEYAKDLHVNISKTWSLIFQLLPHEHNHKKLGLRLSSSFIHTKTILHELSGHLMQRIQFHMGFSPEWNHRNSVDEAEIFNSLQTCWSLSQKNRKMRNLTCLVK